MANPLLAFLWRPLVNLPLHVTFFVFSRGRSTRSLKRAHSETRRTENLRRLGASGVVGTGLFIGRFFRAQVEEKRWWEISFGRRGPETIEENGLQESEKLLRQVHCETSSIDDENW